MPAMSNTSTSTVAKAPAKQPKPGNQAGSAKKASASAGAGSARASGSASMAKSAGAATSASASASASHPSKSKQSAASSSSGPSKPPVASTSSASASASAGPPIRMSAQEMLIHNAISAAPKMQMSQADVFKIEGAPEDPNDILPIINSLIRKSLITIHKPNGRGHETFFRALSKAKARELGAMDQEERMVLDHISSAGNQGMWTRTLKTRSGLHQNSINKAIKALEQKKHIKAVKSVKHPTRKIYMRYDLTPSIEITGGPWYSGNELDMELIELLQALAKKYIKQKSFPGGRPDMMYPLAYSPYLPTAEDVLKNVNATGVLAVELQVDHIEAVLEVLVYDNEVEKIWMRRFKEDGEDLDIRFELTPDGSSVRELSLGSQSRLPSVSAQTGVPQTKKRKRPDANGEASKKRRHRRSASTASDAIDEDDDGVDNDDDGEDDDNDSASIKREIYDDDEFALPPPMDDYDADEVRSKHKRPGPAGNDYYWVYRTTLQAAMAGSHAGSSKSALSAAAAGEKAPESQHVFMYESGLQQTPCGVCPVSEFCYNRGQPRVLPLPGETDLLDPALESGVAGRAAHGGGTIDWRSAVRVKGKYASRRDRQEAQMQEMLKMRVPVGSGELEDADGAWKGGGKVGGKVVAPVNPAGCIYYSQWFGEHVEW